MTKQYQADPKSAYSSRCQQCSSEYSKFQFSCSSEIDAKMISIFDSNLLCHFENSQNCFEAVNQTVGAFQCGNACHKYASNYYLSSPSGVAVSFMSLGPDR
eukprot:NODE_805_length_3794_cov_0.257375.p4 type:complete len:101 gc:universal NODE_805_length_3794_cov_0.257375:469-167(-)